MYFPEKKEARTMTLMDDFTKIDEAYIKAKAEEVTERDLLYVQEHEEEIRGRFLGNGPLGTFIEEIFLAIALVKDYATGKYRKLPYWAIGAIVFMLLYVANPIDLIPDFLIGIGQIDDVIVVTLCLMLVRQEIHDYKHWRETARDDEEDDLDDEDLELD